MSIVLAHITDVHLPTPAVRPTELLGKRILGWLSWRLRRWRAHRPEALAAIMADIARHAGDGNGGCSSGEMPFLLLTGDLVNISTRNEFVAAERWLRTVVAPEHAMLVPGNHDFYVDDALAAGLPRLLPWMLGAGGAGEDVAAGRLPSFPLLRRLGEVSLLGLNSAFAAPWREASGRLGDGQLQRLEEMLRAEGKAGQCRVVLVHHPPLPELGASKPRKALRDAAALEKVLLRAGAELVLFGHTHRWAQVTRRRADGGLMHVLSAASASMRAGHGHAPAAGWQRIAVQRVQRGWRFEVTRRALAVDGTVGERERLELHTAADARDGAAAAD